MALPLMILAAALPLNTGGVVEGGMRPVALVATSVKFAHVRRVLLLVWTTMDRLPKKAAVPGAVEEYRST